MSTRFHGENFGAHPSIAVGQMSGSRPFVQRTLSEMTHSAPTAFGDPRAMLLMGNNWAESANEAA
jgi:hypothetical protein